MRKIEKLKKVFKSKDGKVLASNFLWLALLQIAGYIFPIITLPYLANIIGPDGFGRIAFALSVMVWLHTITDWGFNFIGTRSITQNRHNSEVVSDILSKILAAKLLLCFIVFILLITLIIFIPIFRDNRIPLLVAFIAVPGHIMYPDWFFQGLERMKYITILNLISKTIFTLAVFVFIKEKDDYIYQILFTSCGFVLSGGIAMYVIIYRWGYRLHFIHFKEVCKTLQSGTDVFLNNIVRNLWDSLGVVLLGSFCGEFANGILNAGRKMTEIVERFISVITRVFFPFITRKSDKHAQYAKMSFIFSTIITLICFLSAPIFIKLFFTEEFYSAIPIARLFSISILFYSLSDVYGKNYLIANGYDHILRNITLICSVVTFILMLPLIYYYSYIGATISFLIGIGSIGIASWFSALKIKQHNQDCVVYKKTD